MDADRIRTRRLRTALIITLVISSALILFFASCNSGGEPDCSDCEEELKESYDEFDALLKRYFTLENQAIKCAKRVDSLEKLPPVIVHDTIVVTEIDTLIVIQTDTIIQLVPIYVYDTVTVHDTILITLRDTITLIDTLYQLDTVCVAGPECDTVVLTKILIYEGDTNWTMNTYIACPLEDYQLYTDVNLIGYSTGMYHSEHEYEVGKLKVTINDTDSMIMYGGDITLDVPYKYFENAEYPTRVGLHKDSVRTISYTFYNDNYGYWEDEYQDINVYLYSVFIDGVNVLTPENTTLEGSLAIWKDGYIEFKRNSIVTITLR